jgi:hypothetical protein
MESNLRYYARRVMEEQLAATRAITPQARERHRTLAESFSRRLAECEQAAQQAA